MSIKVGKFRKEFFVQKITQHRTNGHPQFHQFFSTSIPLLIQINPMKVLKTHFTQFYQEKCFKARKLFEPKKKINFGFCLKMIHFSLFALANLNLWHQNRFSQASIYGFLCIHLSIMIYTLLNAFSDSLLNRFFCTTTYRTNLLISSIIDIHNCWRVFIMKAYIKTAL